MRFFDRLRAAIYEPCPAHLDDPVSPMPAPIPRKPACVSDMAIVDTVASEYGMSRAEAIERLQELDLLTLIFESGDE